MYTSSHLGRSSPAGSSSRNDISSSAGTPERTPQMAKIQFCPTSERQRLNLLGRHASWIYRSIATLRSSARRASHRGGRTNLRVAQSRLSSCKWLRGDDCERRGVALGRRRLVVLRADAPEHDTARYIMSRALIQFPESRTGTLRRMAFKFIV